MGDLRLNNNSYSGNGTGVLTLNGVNYTGGMIQVPVSLVPKMVSNSQDGYIARASSEFDSNYQAYMVFDRTTASAWAPQNGQSSNWVEIELPNPRVASRIVVTTRSGGYYARSVTVQGSKDGTNYVTLGTASGMSAGDAVTITDLPRSSFSIYRFVIDDFGLADIYIEGYEKQSEGGGGVDYIESWILKSGSSDSVPTVVIHQTFTDGQLSGIDVKQQGGGATVVSGDLTTYIGGASDWLWRATVTDDMTYKLYDVNNQTEGALQTAENGDIIVDGGDLNTFCTEIRRYS